MDRKKAKRLPVVDDTGRLTGIVSRCDLLQPFLRGDASIREEIVHEILGHILGLPPGAVDVTVDDGVVTLTGTVERESLIPITERLCRSVDGVIAVHQALRHTLDDTPIDIGRPNVRAVLGSHSAPHH
ncbi:MULTISPECIES: BON domain-containing protein [unclassified Kitasatospora]|uniref:BON domain-containing protein n=1 Tax=unclassified Kitasatospora TaxID=2633591 RepID=UPI0033C64D7D